MCQLVRCGSAIWMQKSTRIPGPPTEFGVRQSRAAHVLDGGRDRFKYA
jgi:hypothetical protein